MADGGITVDEIRQRRFDAAGEPMPSVGALDPAEDFRALDALVRRSRGDTVPETAGPGFAPAAPDDALRLFEQLDPAISGRRERARDALSAPGPSPEAAARAARASEALGVPPETLQDMPQTMESFEREQDWEALEGLPELQDWYATDDNANVARDDVTNMALFSRVWRGVEALFSADPVTQQQAGMQLLAQGLIAMNEPSTELRERVSTAEGWRRTARDLDALGRALNDPVGTSSVLAANGLLMVNSASTDLRVQGEASNVIYWRGILGARAMNGTATPSELQELARLEAVQIPEPETPLLGPFLQSWRPTTYGLGMGLMRGTEYGAAAAVAGAGVALAGGQAGPQVALPEEAVTVPSGAALGFGYGFRIGAGVGGFLASAEMEGGLAYSEFRNIRDEDGRPLDDATARAAARVVGALNGGLELVSIRQIARATGAGDLLEGLTRSQMRRLLQRASYRQALGRLAARIGQTSLTEGATEAMQEAVNITAAHVAMDRDGGAFERPTTQENFNRVVQAGRYGAEAGVIFGGAAGSAGFYVDAQRASTAENEIRVLDALSGAAGQSRLRERLPQRFQGFVDEMTRNGPVPSVHVNAQQFFQYWEAAGEDPFAAAERVEPGGAAALREALADNGDLSISTSAFTARMAGSPAYDALREHMRLRPDSMTIAEARAWEANEGPMAERLNEIAREQERVSGEVEAEQLIVADLVRLQRNAGRDSPESTDATARILARAVANISRMAGANPIEEHTRWLGDIRGDDDPRVPAATGQRIDQAEPDVEGFIRDVRQRRPEIGDLRLTYQPNTADLVLDVLGIERKGQKRGVGTATMEELVAFADQHGLRIVTTPPKRGGSFGTRSQGASAAFLRRFGFVDNQGDNADANVRQPMFRNPTGQRRVAQDTNAAPDSRFPSEARENDRSSLPPIPVFGTPEFAMLLEMAMEKMAAGRSLTPLEQWAYNRARAGAGAVRLPGDATSLFEQSDGPVRAGPLPPSRGPSARVAIPPPPSAEEVAARRLRDEQRAEMDRLLAERDRLDSEIEKRIESERDMPEVVEARKWASAYRQAAYCAAREHARGVRAMRAAGGAAGASMAAVGAAAVVATPGEITDRAPAPNGTGASEPSAVVAIPPVELPEVDPADAMAALPADRAETAVAPEAVRAAAAEAAPTVTPEAAPDSAADLPPADQPIITNNRARRGKAAPTPRPRKSRQNKG